MRISTRIQTALAGLAAIAASLGLVAGALGITVYANDFSSEAEFDQIARSGGGKACDRRYRQGQRAMLTSVKRGPLTCGYVVPVQGDSELPNHALGVDAKILADTPNSVQGGAFIELTVRAGGGGTGYTLRVFPAKRSFELIRGPGGAGDFPVGDKNQAIKPIGDRNRLALVVEGAKVSAFANGKELAALADDDPGQVTGRKVRFAIGSAKDTEKELLAVVKAVNVGVPER